MKALLLVDIQNDFLPGGALAVKKGDEILPAVNALLDQPFDLIVASNDWHPQSHISFATTHGKEPGEIVDGQILWPTHCVENSEGAQFPSELNIKPIEKVIYKGTDPKIDSYSAFFDNAHQKSTGLDKYLKSERITDLYIVGLATDYCVKYSALDAINLGYTTHIIEDACRGVNLHPSDSQNALKEMHAAGAHITTTAHLNRENLE